MVQQQLGGTVEFRFFRPGARRVFLVGDFNRWNRTSLPMDAAGDGWWTCLLHVPPAVYQFQYVADGKVYLDYAAFGLERGPLGTWNSVILVEPESVVADRRIPAETGAARRAESRAAAGRPSEAVPDMAESRRPRQLQEA
jgi:1,4-alpha-glucan branching enzyme